MNKKIEQIECYISNLETIVSRNSRIANDEEKKQMETIANKTIAVLKETISKTLAVRSQIANDEEYDKFVDRVVDKTAKVYRATLDKLSLVLSQRPKVEEAKVEVKTEAKVEVKTETEPKTEAETKEEIKTEEASFAKITENENVKPAAKMAKTLKEITDSYADEEKLSSKVISIIDSKKTKDVVNRLSLTALNVADKGLDVLIKLLDKGIK